VKQRRSGARLWLLAFIGFWLLLAGWAFAAPYDGPPDEQQHALRAAAVAHGELVARGEPGAGRPVEPVSPTILFPMHIDRLADCAVVPGGTESLGFHSVCEARLNPVSYAVTWWPPGIWPN
jgi:hypothetical protein